MPIVIQRTVRVAFGVIKSCGAVFGLSSRIYDSDYFADSFTLK
jgi:hypothetical protein